jgi:RNA polymerase sigma-70 factor (ECF subfamily)
VDREPLTVRASSDRSRWLATEILPHEPLLRGWLTRSKVAGLEIDDVVQEAYAVLAGLASVAHIRNPRNYLFQTARSVVLRHLRRSQVVSFQALPGPAEPDFAHGDPSPEDAAILRDQLRQADVLLNALPGRAREAFLLRRIEGLSQSEIAARMNVSENTVEKHIGKALRLILRAVGAAHGGSTPSQVSSPQNTTDGSEATVDKRTRLGRDRNE